MRIIWLNWIVSEGSGGSGNENSGHGMPERISKQDKEGKLGPHRKGIWSSVWARIGAIRGPGRPRWQAMPSCLLAPDSTGESREKEMEERI